MVATPTYRLAAAVGPLYLAGRTMYAQLNRAILWIKYRFPRGYNRVLPLGRALMRLKPPPSRRSHWKMRKHLKYYWEVVRLAKMYVPAGSAMIDVGAGETDVVGALKGFDRRVMLDIHPIRPKRGVEIVNTDFMEYRPDTRFDLVLCLQVLEHLESPEAFARKLFEIGRTVIISVPYRWPEGAWPWHVQDPVDEAKLERWTGRRPTEIRIVADERERLIAVYAHEGTAVAGFPA
jgi:SAM-dependent methyltransferase